ncbi:MAG: PQQ-binding-like beta-propeller repeat protein [Bryobacterales bacterium]|nr:PQQ-binding-like beta-propeller repeat protein [Bryobacterales bacterium]
MRWFIPLFLFALAAPAEDWSRFRGPDGLGTARDSGYPVEFGPARNLVWRTPVRAGKSSPVLSAKHVFLTSAADGKLYTECFDRATGKRLWERAVEQRHRDLANALNHPAAITPAVDREGNVYSFFKDFGVVSYDAAGKLRWQAPLGPFVTSMGLGAAPVLVGGRVIIVADQLEGSFIAAFDQRNGELRWKQPREEAESWGSPLVFGSSVLTVSRGMYGAYQASTGERFATVRGLATTIVASPILVNGHTIYAFGYGGDAPTPFARTLARLDKNGDGKLTQDEYGTDAFVHGIAKYVGNRDMVVTEAEWDEKQKVVGGPTCLFALRVDGAGEARELWRAGKGFNGVIPSPLFHDGVIWVVKNGGILTSYDAAAGHTLHSARVESALGGYSSSPVLADGRIYLSSEEGKIAVLQPKLGGQWEVLKVNDLDEPLYATPALSGASLYVRSGAALYRFGANPAGRR